MSRAFINESTLTAIGDAIRAKTGKSDLIAPGDMPTEIENIPTGGGEIPEEAFVITGNCVSRFANNGWNWFITEFGNRITTQNIQSGQAMFTNCTLVTIPFDFNCSAKNTYSYASMFSGCASLKEIGVLRDMYPDSINAMFENCWSLRTVPTFENFNSNKVKTYGYSNMGSIFSNCYSLRHIDYELIEQFTNNATTSYYSALYYSCLQNCYVLDEVKMPVVTAAYTTNAFTNTFTKNTRLKDMIFNTNEDGSAIVVNWKSQIIDLTTVGYYQGADNSMIIAWNSGITADKQVTDDASYQALKDDPDWFTMNINYSRYNPTSAVNTLNTLPDCSASGGTNTIKFKGAAGALTDGGAVNTLTEEEIAVAAAKGWTVTLS